MLTEMELGSNTKVVPCSSMRPADCMTQNPRVERGVCAVTLSNLKASNLHVSAVVRRSETEGLAVKAFHAVRLLSLRSCQGWRAHSSIVKRFSVLPDLIENRDDLRSDR